MLHVPHWLLASVVAFGLLGYAPAGVAQEDPEERTAAARSLFDEGMSFVDDGDFGAAADRFERSLELRFSPVVAFNLANALVETGRVVEASERLREVIRDPSTDGELKGAAEARLEEVLAQVARLTVRVSGDAETVEVLRDGEVLSLALLGVAQPVDPGSHRVAVRRGDETLDEQEVTVEAGGEAEVTLEAPPPPVPTPEETAREATAAEERDATSPRSLPPPAAEDEGGSVFASGWFWLGVGVVLAGAGVASYIFLVDRAPDPVTGDFEPGLVEVGQ